MEKPNRSMSRSTQIIIAVLGLVLIACVIALALLIVQNNNLNQQTEDLSAQAAQTETAIADLEDTAQAASDELAAAKQTIDDLTAQLAQEQPDGQSLTDLQTEFDAYKADTQAALDEAAGGGASRQGCGRRSAGCAAGRV